MRWINHRVTRVTRSHPQWEHGPSRPQAKEAAVLGVSGVAAEGADRSIQDCMLTQPLQGCVDPLHVTLRPFLEA